MNKQHKNNSEETNSWKPQYPVILLVDNDNRAKAVFNTANNKFRNSSSEDQKIKIENNADFFHLYSNLYLVKTPHIEKNNEENSNNSGNDKQSYIEDLFDQDWLSNVQYDGKTFSKANNFDPLKHFGKNNLATKVLQMQLHILSIKKIKAILLWKHTLIGLLSEIIVLVKQKHLLISGFQELINLRISI